MPSFMYQDMIYQIVHPPIGRSPSVFMNVAVWEHCVLDVAQYYNLIIITDLM
jgi:hypothetical protein